MGFLSTIFHSPEKESLILIDVSAGSVAGAYAHYREGKPPVVLYTRRVPIEVRPQEPHERAMLRALEALGSALVAEGAPILARYSGSGSAGKILLSVDAPWQETKVRTEQFERATPFVFTKSMVATALEKTAVAAPGMVLADETIIGTTLNGYQTREPYGKKVHRSAVIILTSFIHEKVWVSVIAALRKLFHTKNIFSIAGNSLRYQAMRRAFPHERNALIFDILGPLLSIAFVRNGFLVAVSEIPDSVSARDTGAWTERVIGELTELAKRYPLPRTIFLLAPAQDIPALTETLAAANLGKLWLSDNPPAIVPVAASHLNGLVEQAAPAPPDLPLLLMALYWNTTGGH